MVIYHFPDGLFGKLTVLGKTTLSGEASALSLQTVSTLSTQLKASIGDATGDFVGFYGKAPAVQPNYRETATDIATALKSLGLMSTATATA